MAAWWPVAAAGAVVWWMAVRMLWNEWEIDPQYSYGVLVPLLCVALFWMRWRDRPEVAGAGRRGAAVVAWAAAGLLAGLQPVFEANPEWRVLGAAGAFCAVAVTLCALFAGGGWRWVRHFGFPVVFFLIAVPWPRNAEEALMGWLMEHNAIATVEALHWCGLEAVRRGHLIALPSGMLGVEEACSGVRSLQSGIMAALFFGEIHRFGVFSRVSLVVAAVVCALVGNFFRATGLSLIASTQGVGAVDEWHDLAGYLVLGFTIGILWGAAAWHQRRRGSPVPAESRAAVPSPGGLRNAALGIAALGLAALGGTEVWYRAHERGLDEGPGWTLRSGTPGTVDVPVAERTMRILFHPEGFSEKFMDSKGRQWQVFHFKWPPGRTAIQALSIHDPRTCLGSIGMTLEEQFEPRVLTVGGIGFPFRVFLFRDRGVPVLVYHAIIADGRDVESQTGDTTLGGRWDVVRKGIRNRGQRLVEAAVWNTDDIDSAEAELVGYLRASLVTGREEATASR